MSYTNGIGASQQLPGEIASRPSSAASRSVRSESSAVDNPASTTTFTNQVDAANLSSTANVMAQAFSASDVRNGRVAALSQAIAAGTYSVSSSDVASKLISSMLN